MIKSSISQYKNEKQKAMICKVFSILKSFSASNCWLFFLTLLFIVLVGSTSGYPQRGENDPLFLEAEKVKISMITSNMLTDLFKAEGRVVAVGERGHIIISEDNGKTWHQAKSPVSVNLNSVYFPVAETGWIAGNEGVILKTLDGGETWFKQIDRRQVNKIIVSWLEKKVDQTERLSENSSSITTRTLEDLKYTLKTWKEYMVSNSCPPFMDLWFKDNKHGVAVGAFGLFVATRDGGKSWFPLLQIFDNPLNRHYYGITQSGRSLILVGEFGMLFRSSDWGKTWTKVESPCDTSLFGVCASPCNKHAIAFGLNGSIIASGDSGVTWSTIKHSLIQKNNLTGACKTQENGFLVSGPIGQVLKVEKANDKFSLSILGSMKEGTIELLEILSGKVLSVGLNGVQVKTF